MGKAEGTGKQSPVSKKKISTKKKVLMGGVILGGIFVSAQILRRISKNRKRTKAEENFLKGFAEGILDDLDFGIPKDQIQEVKEEIAKTIENDPSIARVDVYFEEEILFV